MYKLRNILKTIIFIEYIVILLLMTLFMNKLSNENKLLEEKVNKIEIQSKLYYEDILELIERK